MTDVKKLLIDTLETAYGLRVYLQGSLADDEEYPASFFTIWNNYSTDAKFYDDSETQTIWNFDLNFYSDNPATVNTMLLDAKALLKSVGFIPDGSAHDVLSDEPTHTGRGLTLLFIDRVR